MKNFLPFLFFAIVLCSCVREDYDIVNLNNNEITIIGHGGMGFGHTYPINSFEAIAYALNIGADGVEVDIEMTKDSVLVAFHDEEMSDKTNGSGPIYIKNWYEISQLNYTNTLYLNYKIVNMDMLFSGLKNRHDKMFILDCKNNSPDTSFAYRSRFCNALLDCIDKYDVQNNVMVELKKEALIKLLKERRPELKIIAYEEFDRALELAEKYNLYGINTSIDKITKDQVLRAHNMNLRVSVFNVNTNERNLYAINMHVDIIQTDRLKHLLKALR